MKNIAFVLFLLVVFKPIVPLMEYIAFYDYFKNELCINRDKPQLECNGKCHLDKEMSKASDTDRPISDKKDYRVQVETTLLFCLSIEGYDLFRHINFQSIVNLLYLNLYRFNTIDEMFHPPSWV